MTAPDRLPPPTAPLDADAARGLERFEAGLDAPLDDTARRAAAYLFACSPFLADFAASRAGDFLAIVEGLPMPPAAEGLDLAIEDPPDLDEIKRRLRRYRNAMQADILARDLTGAATLEETLARLTFVADQCIRAAVEAATASVVATAGAIYRAPAQISRMVVVAMGKLGAGELNFSSDIDLIFVHRASDGTSDGGRALEAPEWYERIARTTVKLLAERTPDGFCYRVDLRLRPFGNSGPTVVSLPALEHYYLVHGRDWERYAMIKARSVCGDPDTVLALDDLVRPFVYRRYLDYGAIAALREMKAGIAREVERAGLEADIKRGAGGIREIEFIGQVFQLMRGGGERMLRMRGIRDVLATLGDLELLEPDEVRDLTDAYRLLREVENRLQGMRDEQTHTLPDGDADRARLALAMRAPDYPTVAARVAEARAAVSAVFSRLLAPASQEADEAPEGLTAEAFVADADAARVEDRLAGMGFEDPANARAIVARELTASLLARLTNEARARLDTLLPVLLMKVAATDTPEVTLERLMRLVVAVARRSVYLAAMTEFPAALERLVTLFAVSPWIAEEITRHPILLDELLDSDQLYDPRRRADLETALGERLARVDCEDQERLMDTLRWFAHREVLRVAASDITAHIPVNKVSDYLTDLAEAVVARTLDLAWDMVSAKHGVPRVDGERVEVTVVAYGKLGGIELGYGSDLDLVFVHDDFEGHVVTDGHREIDAGRFFARLTQRFIHLMTTPTAAGRVYEIDTRLRPSGNSGLMVVSQQAFERYQRKEAWTWEHQALVRARPVAGPAHGFERFREVRKAILTRPRDDATLTRDVVEMRTKMRDALDKTGPGGFDLKHGPGGITDLEFVVQYLVLKWAPREPAIVEFTDNWRLIEALRDAGVLSAARTDDLVDAYFTLRAEGHRQALFGRSALIEPHAFERQRAVVATTWHDVFGAPAPGASSPTA